MNFIERHVYSFWDRRKDQLDGLNATEMKYLRRQAREFMSPIVAFDQAVTDRLQGELLKKQAIPVPDGSDWKTRPDLWLKKLTPPGLAPVRNGDWLGDEIQMFHDCPLRNIIVRQNPNSAPEASAPYELNLDVFDFKGSFVSIIYNFPKRALQDLSRRHIVRVQLNMTSTSDLSAYVQLNVKHGPNIEQVVADFDADEPEPLEFDLAYTEINEKRVSEAWIGIILNNPCMANVRVTDLICSRRLRADF